MAVLARTKVQQAPDSASDRVNGRCLDNSTRTRQAPCDTFPVYFPSFQQLVSQGLPELTGLSLNLISPDGFVSRDLIPVVLRARADLQHPLCPSAGGCRGQAHHRAQSTGGHFRDPGGEEKGARLRTAEAKSLKLNSSGKKVAQSCFRSASSVGSTQELAEGWLHFYAVSMQEMSTNHNF